MNFFEEQLRKEINYIESKYLFSLVEYDNQFSVEDNFIVKNILLNNIQYKMYIKKNSGFDIMLIPNDNFNFLKDFKNIIKYKKNKNEIQFSLISKKENYIRQRVYNFFSNESGYSIGNYFYDDFYDKNNFLELEYLKNNTSMPNFLYNFNIKKLTNSGYKLDRIKRNKDITKINRINEVSLLRAYELYDTHFTQIDDNDSTFLEIFENLYKKESVKTRN